MKKILSVIALAVAMLLGSAGAASAAQLINSGTYSNGGIIYQLSSVSTVIYPLPPGWQVKNPWAFRIAANCTGDVWQNGRHVSTIKASSKPTWKSFSAYSGRYTTDTTINVRC